MAAPRHPLLAAAAALLLQCWAVRTAPPGLAEWQARRVVRAGATFELPPPFTAPLAAPPPGLALAARAGDGFIPVRAANALLMGAACAALAAVDPPLGFLAALSPGFARDGATAGAGLALLMAALGLAIGGRRRGGGAAPAPPLGPAAPDPVHPFAPGGAERDAGVRGSVTPGGGRGGAPPLLLAVAFALLLLAAACHPLAPAERGDPVAAGCRLLFREPHALSLALLLALVAPALTREDRAPTLALILAAAAAAWPFGGAPPLFALAALSAAASTLRRLPRFAAAVALALYLVLAVSDARATFARPVADPHDADYARAATLAAGSGAGLLVAKAWCAPLLGELSGLPAAGHAMLEADTPEENVKLDPAVAAALTARAIVLLHHGDDDGRPPLTGDRLLERLRRCFEMKEIGAAGLFTVWYGRRIEP